MSARLRNAQVLLGAFICALFVCTQSHSQSIPSLTAIADARVDSPANSRLSESAGDVADLATVTAGTDVSESLLPSAPEPAGGGAGFGKERAHIPASGTEHYGPFSRIGIGANLSPLGIDINGTTVLDDFFDLRVMGNFFSYTQSQFDVEGFTATANVHFASMATSIDWYPYNSIFRISPGVMFFNGNQFSVSGSVAGGTNFTLNGKNFWSASANSGSGATPLTGSGTLGLHTNMPAFTVAGGFGKFVPRSERHWSFPAEYGVVFMGAPTANVNVTGWVCTNPQLTQCSDIGNTSNPVAQQFNNALQTQLSKWRHDLSLVQVYPILSYGFVYSFDVR
jgi:hypothetical protein